jgi:hypothetical protein
MLIIGGGLLVVAVVCGVLAWQARRRTQAIDDAMPALCGDLGRLAGPGDAFTAGRVKLKGSGRAQEAPLTSPLASQPCVWYRTRVTEHYRVREMRGSGDNRTETLVDKHRVVSDEASEATFLLADETGTVPVDPHAAKVDQPVEVFDRTDTGGGGILGATRLTVDLGPIRLGNTGEGTVGYRHEEWIIPVDQALYVVGEVSGLAGTARVAKPASGGELLISTRSEDQVRSGSQRRLALLGVGSAASLVAAIVLLALGAKAR